MTYRYLSIFVFSALLLVSTSCKKAVNEKPEDVASATLLHPFFYKVEGDDGAMGYLLGTMHMGVDAEKELPSYVWDIINDTKILAVEADISDPSLAMGMMLPKDTNLRKEIGEETWKLLEKALGEQMANMLMPMKPAAAAAILAMKDLPKTVPMDMFLLNNAKAREAELSYLETGKFQLDLLTKVMTADYLGEILRDPDASDSAKLLQVYRDGDEKALAELMLDPKAWGSAKKGKANMDMMLYSRNRDWISKLEVLFAKKTALVAVGAAHLIGANSVVELLKQKGYKVTRIGQ